jgi:hypothetical protein
VCSSRAGCGDKSQVRFGGQRRGNHRPKDRHRRLAADPAQAIAAPASTWWVLRANIVSSLSRTLPIARLCLLPGRVVASGSAGPACRARQSRAAVSGMPGRIKKQVGRCARLRVKTGGGSACRPPTGRVQAGVRCLAVWVLGLSLTCRRSLRLGWVGGGRCSAAGVSSDLDGEEENDDQVDQ